MKACGCHYGACDCYKETAQHIAQADIFYDRLRDEFFQLSLGASSMSPVGWCINCPSLVYLGKVGDSYYETIGRQFAHEQELTHFLIKRAKEKKNYDAWVKKTYGRKCK